MTADDVARAPPGIEEPRDRSRGLAVPDAVLRPEREDRHHFLRDHPDPDGSGRLLRLLADRSAEAYAAWASDHDGRPVDLAAARHVLAPRPLTAEVVAALDPATDLTAFAEDLAETGSPTA